MTRKRRLIAVLVVLALLGTIWIVVNPPGRFGWCCYAYTTYGAIPRPVSDFQIRADGRTRSIAKTHHLTYEQIEWLLEPRPDVLIIALGWDGVVAPDDRIREHRDCETRLLKNKQAIELFNSLKRAGKRVAIHYHSTC